MLLLIEAPVWRKTEVDLVDSLAKMPDVVMHEVPDDSWEVPDFTEFDAVVVYMPFRNIRKRPPIPWSSYSGLKVMVENDAFMDFCGWRGPELGGQWSDYLPTAGLDLLVVSGRSTADHFAKKGYATAVVAKGYSPGIMSDLDVERSGVCHFGRAYPARLEMMRQVRKAGISIDNVFVPLPELNATLNGYLANVVCNMTTTIPFGRVGRGIERYLPGRIITVLPGPEPMMKNFEATRSGCAVFMDDVADLEPLGFVDGETAVIYRDFDELIDKLRYWLVRPEELRQIGRAGAAVSEARHSWAHRATELFDLVTERVATHQG